MRRQLLSRSADGWVYRQVDERERRCLQVSEQVDKHEDKMVGRWVDVNTDRRVDRVVIQVSVKADECRHNGWTSRRAGRWIGEQLGIWMAGWLSKQTSVCTS